MFIKIYFNDKTVFLCDSIDATIEPLVHLKSTVLVDDFSDNATKKFIREMEEPGHTAGVFVHQDLDALLASFISQFHLIQAGGGLVFDPSGNILMIFRRGVWDLPKGKLDEGETLEACALREVTEETGLHGISLQHHLITTWHTYYQDGKHVLKETRWYRMAVTEQQSLTPQLEEGILEARWIKPQELPVIVKNTFASIRDVLEIARINTAGK